MFFFVYGFGINSSSHTKKPERSQDIIYKFLMVPSGGTFHSRSDPGVWTSRLLPVGFLSEPFEKTFPTPSLFIGAFEKDSYQWNSD